MNQKLKKWVALLSAGVMTLSMASCAGLENLLGGNSSVEDDGPIVLKNVVEAKNVILFIGDGMGPDQVRAGELYKGETLTMQSFPYAAKMKTRSLSDAVTDSAAAATALATGTRTINGVVGRDENGKDLKTIVDVAAKMGKRTGILTTEEIYKATPMGFAGHSASRDNYSELHASAIATGNVNLFASYKVSDSYRNAYENAGYEKISNVADMSEATSDKIYGSYTIRANAPSMSAGEEMGTIAFDRVVMEALEYLSKDEDGFFLMAEGSHIDHGGHNNDLMYMLQELLAFDDAIQAALKWAKGRDDTVVIVTADHETGGLELSDEATTDNLFDMSSGDGGFYYTPMYYAWTTTSHTATDVWFYVNGADVDFASYSLGDKATIQNIDTFQIIKDLMGAD